MKRASLLLLLLMLALGARAQFSPNTILTAAALNSAISSPTITGGSINGSTSIFTTGTVTLNGINTFGVNTSGVTQGYIDNSTHVATTAYARQAVQAAMAMIPMAVTSGTYNFAPAGTGAIFGVTTSGGALASITSIISGGSGYQVGDCLIMVGGNGDGIVYVNSVSSGVITAASILYGGTGYSGTPQLSGTGIAIGSRSRNLTGALTGNVTIILPSASSLLAGSRRLGIQNNTTGPYSVTVKLSNGSGGSMGTGTVIPQGTANSTSIELYTDGMTDIWPEVGSAPNFVVPGTFTLQGLAVKPVLSGTTGSLGGSSLGQGACSSVTTTVTGATNAMAVNVTPATFPGAGFFWKGWVSSTNTVSVEICSSLGGNNTPTASVYNVRVQQ